MAFLKIDIISNKEFLLKARRFLGKVPFALIVYKLFWRIRTAIEFRSFYPNSDQIIHFGEYPEPSIESPTSQLCTAKQIRTATYQKWCDLMGSPVRFSRKQWEFVFIMQSLKVMGKLGPGMTGLGFGCGREPLPGVFSSFGCQIMATDLDSESANQRGWVDTFQHAASLEELYIASRKIIPKSLFYERVKFSSLDMNKIPSDFDNRYDFTWSACALEHLGSLEHGLQFIKNSLKYLKSGGVAVHTTEFNLSSNDGTFESPGCSLYREKDLTQLFSELASEGYKVLPLNLNTGQAHVDNYIDCPPYGFSPHLKLQLENHVVTSVGLIISKH